ncbi:hypothetical protein V493_05701 [Pseudogymnoascus sp. VKM F-4281 (FW-2241)]|nr:hypothetical protein V493_05701 [Pseudogymnoascus sp. VKM F-4281 (FW-2241)]
MYIQTSKSDNKEPEPEPGQGESPIKKQGNPENPGQRGKRWDGIGMDKHLHRPYRFQNAPPAESDVLTGPRTSIKDVNANAGTRRRSAAIGAMGSLRVFRRLSESVIGLFRARYCGV